MNLFYKKDYYSNVDICLYAMLDGQRLTNMHKYIEVNRKGQRYRNYLADMAGTIRDVKKKYNVEVTAEWVKNGKKSYKEYYIKKENK